MQLETLGNLCRARRIIPRLGIALVAFPSFCASCLIDDSMTQNRCKPAPSQRPLPFSQGSEHGVLNSVLTSIPIVQERHRQPPQGLCMSAPILAEVICFHGVLAPC